MSSLLGTLVTTVNGPAPTGCWPNDAPSVCRAVGEAIQFGIESNSWSMKAPLGAIWWTTIVYGPVTWMAPAAGGSAGGGAPGTTFVPFGTGCSLISHGGLRPLLMPTVPRSRFQL